MIFLINREENPEFLNSFLDYNITILNKSPNTVKEYNYDIVNFLKFIKSGKKTGDFKETIISNITIEELKEIKLEDIHSYIAYMATYLNSKPTTRARKVSTLRVFFKYLAVKAKLIDINPAQNLETPKLGKRMPKYLSLDESRQLLDVTHDENNRNNLRDYAIITLFLNCGMRLSELVNIDITDINFNDCKLNVIGKGNRQPAFCL